MFQPAPFCVFLRFLWFYPFRPFTVHRPPVPPSQSTVPRSLFTPLRSASFRVFCGFNEARIMSGRAGSPTTWSGLARGHSTLMRTRNGGGTSRRGEIRNSATGGAQKTAYLHRAKMFQLAPFCAFPRFQRLQGDRNMSGSPGSPTTWSGLARGTAHLCARATVGEPQGGGKYESPPQAEQKKTAYLLEQRCFSSLLCPPSAFSVASRRPHHVR